MEFKDCVIKSNPIGSRYTCNPPVMDTDRDTLCLVTNVQDAEERLLKEGWTPCYNGEYVGTYFKAFRKGEDNYVVTAHEEFFDRYVIAAEVSRSLNLKEKADRIKVHNACIAASKGYMGLIEWDDTFIPVLAFSY